MSRTTPGQASPCFFEGVAKKENTDYIVLAPASFLTFGKVSASPPETDIFLGRGVPTHPRSLFFVSAGLPQTDFFFSGGGGGGVQITNLPKPDWASLTSSRMGVHSSSPAQDRYIWNSLGPKGRHPSCLLCLPPSNFKSMLSTAISSVNSTTKLELRPNIRWLELAIRLGDANSPSCSRHCSPRPPRPPSNSFLSSSTRRPPWRKILPPL